MSITAKSAVMLGLVVLAAACSRNVDDAAVQEVVIIEPEPITVEPEFTGKYK